MALSTTGLRDRFKAKFDAALGAVPEPHNAKRLAICLAMAEGVVEEIQANGKARITTSDAGLQRVTLVDTQAPAANKEIALV